MNDRDDAGPQRVQPSWRQHALARADELGDLAAHFESRAGADQELVQALKRLLADARVELTGWRRIVARVGGSDVEHTMAKLSAAEAHLLRLADDHYVAGEYPSILKHVARHLPVDDPRRQRVQDIVNSSRNVSAATTEDREVLIAASRGASTEAGREIMRVRSFRNVIVVASLILAGVAVSLAVYAAANPARFPLCFAVEKEGAAPATPSATVKPKVVCPSEEVNIRGDEDAAVEEAVDSGDVMRIELLGVIAAAVAAATSLSSIRGTSTPFSVPVALAVLKLPTGALTAVLGILLMRAQFLPGLSALDTSAQILGWAVVFGYAQQLFTGAVDAQAGRVLDEVRGGLTRSTAN